LKNGKSHKLLGLASINRIDDSELIVDKIFTISRLGAPIIRLDKIDDGMLFACAINGPSSVKDTLNFNGRLDKLKLLLKRIKRCMNVCCCSEVGK
jgi:hypothetical protein